MGILNITPDSFFDGGKHFQIKYAINHAEQMISEGADIIDIGAYSSRPKSTDISAHEEWSRLNTILPKIRNHFPEIIISVDTFRASIAQKAIEEGADMINDISAGELDSEMHDVIIKYNIPYIMMHMKGTPQTMQEHTNYHHLLNDIIDFFSTKIQRLKEKGATNLILDPGFGFSKTLTQNYELLNQLNLLKILELPLLVGLSRKSMIYRLLNTTAQNALNGTTALNMVALMKGASLLRVHDVKEAVETVKLFQELTAHS